MPCCSGKRRRGGWKGLSMPELVVYRDECGKLQGHGEKGRRAWDKFRRVVAGLEPGETMGFSYRLPRSPQHHRFFFARLGELFDRQDRFDDKDRLLDWLKVGAGFVDLLPGRDGMPVAIPRSIAWHSLDEQEFIEFTRAMNDFLATPYAQEVLWPHLLPSARHRMLEFGR